MTEEIPIWVNGIIQWISGVDRKTTCKDVIEALLAGEGNDKHNAKEYTIMERWRRVERPLDENSKILKIWSHWGDEKKEVRLCLKRINNDIDSGRGSPVAVVGNTPSLKRRRHHRSRVNGKPPWGHQETLHPKRLAELGELRKEEYEEYQARKLRQIDPFDDQSEIENVQPIYDSRHCTYGDKMHGKRHDETGNSRKKSGMKSYHCAGTGFLHSTLLQADERDPCKPTTSKCCTKRQSKSKIRNSENIEKLMKLILAQGATIQSQLQKLKEREEQIESLEHERHRERVEKNGRNYLLETYLGSLNEAEIPAAEEERGNDSGVHTEGGSDHANAGWTRRQNERLQDSNGNCDAQSSKQPGQADRFRSENADESSSVEQSESKTSPSRSKRSRSECRSAEWKSDSRDGGNTLKRTSSENALSESSKAKIGGDEESAESIANEKPREDRKEESSDLLELRRIQSQVEMWEKVFKINKKLEREEENLVRLHIKIKRFQAESTKFAKDEDGERKTDAEADRISVQKDLENLREDLDQNSKQIYKNFTKMMENDEVVERKRTILNRLMNDLEKTEREHSILTEMVFRQPPEPLDQREGRTSFSEKTDEELSDGVSANPPEIVPIWLYNTPKSTRNQKASDSGSSFVLPPQTAPPSLPHAKQKNIQFNQRIETFAPSEQDSVKPKTVKISFEDQIRNFQNGAGIQEKSKEMSTGTPGTIKGILKNRKAATDKCDSTAQRLQKCETDAGDERNAIQPEKCQVYQLPVGVPEERLAATPYPVGSTCNGSVYRDGSIYYRQRPIARIQDDAKSLYSSKFQRQSNGDGNEQGMYSNGNIMSTKTNIHNDTDSSTSSDTSGLCSMYSSSPTAEEPYTEPSYVLDTLV